MRALALLLALLAGLIALELGGERADPLAAEAEFLAPLAPGRAGLEVAGLSVLHGERGHLYLRREGQWRCATAFDALALGTEVEAVVRELTEAAGPLRAVEPGREVDYGFGVREMLTVTLHGPRLFEDPLRDTLLAVELGNALPGPDRGRVFARLAEGAELRAIQRNPRPLLESGDALPPLLDRRVLAGEFPGRGEGVVRAFVDFADGRALELRLERTPEAELLPGQAPEEWIALADGARARCLPFRVAAWQAFLFRVPYLGLASPADAPERGFDLGPSARVTLVLSDASPVELRVGRALAGGRVYVKNEKTGTLCRVDAAHAPLFAPTVEMLSETGLANPWEEWLRW